MISDILLGIAVGTFIAAIVNHSYNTVKWIKTRHLLWIGFILLVTSFILDWPDLKRGFQSESGFEGEMGFILFIEPCKAKIIDLLV